MMKNQNLAILLLVIAAIFTKGQVGINTATPKKMLHVNGSLQFTNELNVGGNDATPGSAGVYGMNFDNMPELKTSSGYYCTLGLMAAIVIMTYLYLKQKKWK
jgi:hypothetical protein